jgi:predicted type IV restriction endonuclease
MDAIQLAELAQRYKDHKEYIKNEETTKSALVMPFIQLLGYDPNNPREVRLEYSAEFTQGDGKRSPDRMDFAIFDKAGLKPHMVIETKCLGEDLEGKSQQLARYIAQMLDLHFGVITDGCKYLFYGDLDNPNIMDKEPFFRFSLDDENADWSKVAKFLTKFGRDSFNAETLVTDAENSRYRQAMIEKLTKALRDPASDENFLKWLTEGIYIGKRTSGVLTRLSEVARESVEPALLKVISYAYAQDLQVRILSSREGSEGGPKPSIGAAPGQPTGTLESGPLDAESAEKTTKGTIETTDEELEFYAQVKQVCAGVVDSEQIIYKDTIAYFNVSFKAPTRWFVRLFSSGKRKSIVTLVPLEEAKSMCEGFEVVAAPSIYGVSKVYIQTPAQVWAVKNLVLRSLQILNEGKPALENGKGPAPV